MKIFTQELKEKLVAHLSSKDVKDIITKMKGAKDTGTFEMIISSEHVDRSGEIVLQDGIDTSYYLKNPIVLSFHDYYAMPIGVTDSLEIKVINGVKCMIAKGRFAPTEDGQEARTLYEAKMLNTSSIGFIPKLWGENNTIVQCQLLEWSFVPVPCNPEAISMLNLDFDKLVKKGIIIKNEETVADAVSEEDKETVIDKDDTTETTEEIVVAKDETVADPETPAEELETNVEEATPQEDGKKPDAEDVVPPEDQEADDGVADEKAINKTGTKNARIREKLESLESAIKDLKSELDKSDDEVPENTTDTDVQDTDKKIDGKKFDSSDLDTYLNIRQILKNVNNLTSNGLAKLNRNSKKFIK